MENVTLYMQSSNNLLFVKEFKLLFSASFDESENKANHLLNVLTEYGQQIEDPETFYAQIGFKIDDELIQIILQKKEMHTKCSRNGTVINRLVNELGIDMFESILLKIRDFNGCFDGRHPENLLVDDIYSSYMSKRGVTSGDWIIFEIDNDTKYVPKLLKIKNDNDEYGIKEISLSFQYSDSDKWTNKQSIKNIHNNNKDDQWFDVNHKVFDQKENDRKLTLIKLVIDENHGRGLNSFYSFTVFV